MAGKSGICCAGNMLVDITYPIEAYPKQNELTHITDGIEMSTGGSVCNTIADLARLDPTMHLVASGFAGYDAEGEFMLKELGKYPNINLEHVKREGRTSFTAVMSNNQTKERTFFVYGGANKNYCEKDIDWDKLDVNIFHIGYLLLLPFLDQENEIYGTNMAKLLHDAQEKGFQTSIDVVTEAGDRFQKIVRPALRYTDYCIINELEAQQITGIVLREEDGTLHPENMKDALGELKKLGVSTWAVIHCPEMGCGLDSQNNYYAMNSLKLPKGYIKGSVGAGDAFCAGVLYAAEKKLGIREGLKIGTSAAAAALSSVGASEGVKRVDEVLELYQRYKGE